MTPDWMTHADCADTDPALFFPEVGENAGSKQGRSPATARTAADASA